MVPRLSGTRVLRDFVELPSQLFEHWMAEPEVLRRHARHFETGAAIPQELVDRLQAAGRFGEAYETVRYCGSAIADSDRRRAGSRRTSPRAMRSGSNRATSSSMSRSSPGPELATRPSMFTTAPAG